MRQTKQNGRKRFRKKSTRRLRKKRAMTGGGMFDFLKSEKQKTQEAEAIKLKLEEEASLSKAAEDSKLKKQAKKDAKEVLKTQKNKKAEEAAEIIDDGNINEDKLTSFMSTNNISLKKLALLKIINSLIDNENVKKYFQKIFDVIDEFNNLSDLSEEPIQSSDETIQSSDETIQSSDETIQSSDETIQSSDETIQSSDDTIKTVYSNIVSLIGTYDELNKNNNALSLAQQFVLKLYKIPNNMLQQPDTKPETNPKYQILEIIRDPYIRLFLKNILIFQNKKNCKECIKRNPQNPKFCEKTCDFNSQSQSP
jgi:hypothetical protein